MKNNIGELTLKDLLEIFDIVSIQIVLINFLQLIFFFIDYEDYGIINERHWYITFMPWLVYFGTLFLASVIKIFLKLIFKQMIVYKFSSSTCGPCRMLKPIWDDVVKAYSDKNITFKEFIIDTDNESYSLAIKFNVNKVPTIIILNDKMEIIDRFEGMINKVAFKTKIDKHLLND